MGDMADMALNDVFDDMDAVSDFRRGEMTIEEAYDRGIIDELGADIKSLVTRTCRCCGKTGLRWDKLEGKWRLFDGKSVHRCLKVPLNNIK